MFFFKIVVAIKHESRKQVFQLFQRIEKYIQTDNLAFMMRIDGKLVHISCNQNSSKLVVVENMDLYLFFRLAMQYLIL